jgi:membrane-bound lytic murein transglycosylase D
MPETMRLLMGSHSVSRRSEVFDSTVAAAKLLKQNFDRTQSWPLALTAYNHGLNGVMKAVQRTGSRDLCTIIERYESPSFRFASSNFYAQFLAARNVAIPRYAELVKSGNGPKALKPLLSRKLGVSL